MKNQVIDIKAGRAERDQAIIDHQTNRRVWIAHARAVADKFINTVGIVHGDMIRGSVPIPEGVSGRVIGAVFVNDEWVAIGTAQSQYKHMHASRMTVWAKRDHGSIPNYEIEQRMSRLSLCDFKGFCIEDIR